MLLGRRHACHLMITNAGLNNLYILMSVQYKGKVLYLFSHYNVI